MHALVFDLDGTLVETAPDLSAALNHVLAAEGRPEVALAEVRSMVGDGARALIARGLAASGSEPTANEIERRLPLFLEHYGDHIADQSRAYEGVVDTLSLLAAAGHPMGVCTNKPIVLTERLLEALDLARFFDVVLGGDSLPVRKPDPGHLLAVVERLQAAAERTVMIGDSRNDILSGRAAGMTTVAVAYGYSQVPAAELGASHVIERFSDLPETLSGLA